jgi:beta-N-acetylhexosaminidase
MLAFDGVELPGPIEDRLVRAPAAGVTLFRSRNVADPAQVRRLTASIQLAAARGRASPDAAPVLIAADQEGGQLIALGDATTPFAGNMALGAVGDPELAEQVGRAIGLELRALGVNVAYGPVCDVASRPDNPGIGIRSFGEDPGAVAALGAAVVRGLRSAGVAATAKHFPGMGEAVLDPHRGLPVIDRGPTELDAIELVPFRAAIGAGADLVMSAHVALPRLTGDPSLPATLSDAVLRDLLRGELGFEGLVISDALDMRALPQGPEQAVAVIAALRAGIDLLLLAPDEDARLRIEAALVDAASRGLIEPAAVAASTRRLEALRTRLAGFAQPDLQLVGGVDHARLAAELAERSVTLVRDEAGLLPLRLDPGARLLAVMPAPRDLTPADTSSMVSAGLAAALRSRHDQVDEIVTGHPPSEADIASVRGRAVSADAVIVGTIAASFDRAQVGLVEAVLDTGVPTVTVALRTPYDLAAYPAARTHACTYGILAPSLVALAAALFGAVPFAGRLPVSIPDIAPLGPGATG